MEKLHRAIAVAFRQSAVDDEGRFQRRRFAKLAPKERVDESGSGSFASDIKILSQGKEAFQITIALQANQRRDVNGKRLSGGASERSGEPGGVNMLRTAVHRETRGV